MIDVSSNVYTYLSSLFGEDDAKRYVEFIKNESAQYIRANTLKTDRDELSRNLFQNYGIVSETIPNFPHALKIIKKNNLTGKTVEHIIGDFYIQSLSSMIPPMILNPSPGDVVLDLCSAPGSKTTELGEMMRNSGTLIANEIALDRVKMLVYNLDRMNIINSGVVHNKGEWLSKIYNAYFDKILVDAPCSGLGIIQKKEEVSNWWSLERAERLGDLQLRLLIAAIKMVKVGGQIVYSTCTLTPEENEFIINKVLQKYPVEILGIELPISSHEGFTSYKGIQLHPEISKARRILPWEADSDGFFIVKLRKVEDTTPPEPLKLKRSNLFLLNYEKKEPKKLLANIESDFGIPGEILANYKFLIKRNDIYFVNKNWNDEHLDIFDRIGTKFGIINKLDQVTLHTQAAQVLQKFITKNIYNVNNLEELKTYLDGGTIKNDSLNTGQCVVMHNGSILGTAVVTKDGIKSRFPRAKRTQDIIVS